MRYDVTLYVARLAAMMVSRDCQLLASLDGAQLLSLCLSSSIVSGRELISALKCDDN